MVRELTQKRVWFAAALISATAAEVQQLIAQAKAWAKRLDKKVVLWISDKQSAFVTGIAAEFPNVPHRYCANHFLRDVAKPVLEADSHAKVTMRKKVRGLRKIEQAVLKASVLWCQTASWKMVLKQPQLRSLRESWSLPRCFLQKWTRRATWCWTTALPSGAFLITIRAGRSIRPDYRWPTLWVKSGSRSNTTWTRKKGVR